MAATAARYTSEEIYNALARIARKPEPGHAHCCRFCGGFYDRPINHNPRYVRLLPGTCSIVCSRSLAAGYAPMQLGGLGQH